MSGAAREIKRRIRGVSNTRQITKAMELVSSAKLRKARQRLEKSKPYYTTIMDNIQDVLSSSGDLKHPYLLKREVKKSLYIIISSDRGLAGGFNANITRLLEEEIRDKKEKASLLVIGSKARDYFRRKGYDISETFLGITEDPEFSDAREISNLALNLYEDEEIDEINLVYTEFLGVISYKPKMVKLLPFESKVEEKEAKVSSVIEFEPSAEEVLNYLIPKYLSSTIYGALIESSASQQGSRRVAMESATDNAGDIIEDLEISYNRARQAAVTMEISEIVSGAEALK